MILLNVKYKCTENFGKEDFYPFIFDWIVKTRDLRYRMDLDEQTYDTYQIYEYQKRSSVLSITPMPASWLHIIQTQTHMTSSGGFRLFLNTICTTCMFR